MSDPAFGAAFARQPDPTQETHYALSELAKYELDTLFAAMNTMGGILAEAPPDLDPLQVAPFFAAMGAYGARILADAPAIFPRRAAA